MVKFVSTSTKTDTLTGEILERTQNVFSSQKLDKEPAFVKMYINDLGAWQGLTKTETELLYKLTGTVDYDGIIQVTTYTKNKICLALKIKPQSFANALSTLVSKLILQRLEGAPKQVFTLNPFYFGKGDWKDIIEQRKAFVIQITKAYGMELPAHINPQSFISYKTDIDKHKSTIENDAQQRLID